MEVKKIVIVGPESTGKTELSKFLAHHYNSVWVPEFARDYLNTLGRPYREEDLLTIAKGQLTLEKNLIKNAHPFLICDTNLLVIKIWSEFKYHRCDPYILSHLKEPGVFHYLLTNIDLPWEDDPLREHPHSRGDLFALYQDELQKQNTPFTLIQGERQQRRNQAIEVLSHFL